MNDQPPTPEAVKAAFMQADLSPYREDVEAWTAATKAIPPFRLEGESSPDAAARILAAHARAKEAELAEKQASFDLRWKADMRAIKRWQEAHPDQELTWPDHADLVVWQQSEVERLRAALEKAVPHMESGLENTRELLAQHDHALGRTTQKNEGTAKIYEGEIQGIGDALKSVRNILSGKENG